MEKMINETNESNSLMITPILDTSMNISQQVC